MDAIAEPPWATRLNVYRSSVIEPDIVKVTEAKVAVEVFVMLYQPFVTANDNGVPELAIVTEDTLLVPSVSGNTTHFTVPGLRDSSAHSVLDASRVVASSKSL